MVLGRLRVRRAALAVEVSGKNVERSLEIRCVVCAVQGDVRIDNSVQVATRVRGQGCSRRPSTARPPDVDGRDRAFAALTAIQVSSFNSKPLMRTPRPE